MSSHAAIAFARVRRSRRARLGAGALVAAGLVAVLADVIASEAPIAGSGPDGVYVLPELLHPSRYDGLSADEVRALHAGDAALRSILPHGPHVVTGPALAPPSGAHPLGTDEHGRDVAARVVHGARTALGASAAGIGLGMLLGVILGGLAGHLRGSSNRWLERLVEIVDTFPAIIVVALLRAIEGTPTAASLIIAVAVVRWAEVARLVRAEVIRASLEDYAVAARALGASRLGVLVRHLLPNAAGPVVVSSVFGVASVTLLETAISFLALGGETLTPSWGELIAEGARHPDAPWTLAAAPLLLLALVVAGSYLLADALRDALDPHVVRTDLPPLPDAERPIPRPTRPPSRLPAPGGG